MSTYRGHYLPVDARREVLRIYRDRRVNGTPFTGPRLTTIQAMLATADYFEGWLAHAVAFGPIGRQDVKALTDQYRAAQFYLERLYSKPKEFQNRRPSYLRLQRHLEIRRQIAASL